MSDVIKTDVLIIGAGPVGLFAVFELGLLDIKAHVVDILDKIGGQCAELYPEKPIYDIPGFPIVTGQGLADNLLKQIEPFGPTFHLVARWSQSIERIGDPRSASRPMPATCFEAKVVIIAAGGGSFQPKRPPIAGIEAYEGTLVFYAVRRMEDFRDRTILIVGGGDSALDWTLNLQPIAKRVTLLHRRDEFRAAPAFASSKMRALVAEGEMDLQHRPGDRPRGRGRPARPARDRARTTDGDETSLPSTRMLPFFGLTMKLGPVADWGLNLHENLIPSTPRSSRPRARHLRRRRHQLVSRQAEADPVGLPRGRADGPEAHRYVYPDKRLLFQYTTSSSSLQKKLGVL